MKKIISFAILMCAVAVGFWMTKKYSGHNSKPSELVSEKSPIVSNLLESISKQNFPKEGTSSQLAIPSRFKNLLEKTDEYPRGNEIQKLSSSDTADLNAAYEITPLRERKKLTWALASVGDEKSIGLLTNALLNEFKDKSLNEAETYVLYDTVRVLGYLAAKYDSAFGFLKQGTEFEFWKQNRTWTGSSDSYGGTERILVSNSIIGLGLSGRDEARSLLEALAKRDPVYVYKVCGDIASSIYYYDLVTQRGTPAILSLELSGADEGTSMYFDEWKKTENGKKWTDWSLQVFGHKPEGVK